MHSLTAEATRCGLDLDMETLRQLMPHLVPQEDLRCVTEHMQYLRMEVWLTKSLFPKGSSHGSPFRLLERRITTLTSKYYCPAYPVALHAELLLKDLTQNAWAVESVAQADATFPPDKLASASGSRPSPK